MHKQVGKEADRETMTKWQRGEATYLSTAVKMILSVALGFLLYRQFPEIFSRTFLRIPMSCLQKSYGYSDSRPTYQNTVRDMPLCREGKLPDLPDAVPAEYHEISNPDVPSRPTNPVLSQQGTDLVLAWSVPLLNGGAPILGYRVYVDGQLLNASLIHDSREIIPGLAMKSHSIKITAVNSAGEGPPVEAHFHLNAMVPGEPSGISVSSAGRDVSVVWKAPASDGGSSILGYNVYRNGVQQNQSLSAGTSYTVKNLSAGTYTFYVVAVNAVGPGNPSSSVSICLKTAPDPPENICADVSGQTVTVSWAAPQKDGGSMILGYNVYINGIKRNSTLISGRRYALGGVKSGNYSVFVTAVNSLGESGASIQADSVNVSTIPGAPGDVKGVQYGTDRIQVSWTAPGDTGNQQITGYSIYIDSIKINSAPVLSESTKGSFVTESGYQPGYHSVSVTAVNSLGESEAGESGPVYLITAPSVPGDVSASFGPVSAEIRWTAPESDGYSDILEYDVYLDNVKQAVLSPGATSYDFGIIDAGQHRFSVSAGNRAGESPKGSVTGIAPEQVSIRAVSADTAQGDAYGSVTAYQGYEVEIEAVPKAGYEFDFWESDGVDVSHSRKESVTADQNKTFYAVFRKSN